MGKLTTSLARSIVKACPPMIGSSDDDGNLFRYRIPEAGSEAMDTALRAFAATNHAFVAGVLRGAASAKSRGGTGVPGQPLRPRPRPRSVDGPGLKDHEARPRWRRSRFFLARAARDEKGHAFALPP